MVRPLLGDIELQQVQKIETEADQVFTQHSIPALEGDFFQGLGRRNTWVKLTGVLTGAEVKTGLKDLRDKFREAQPVDFVADIATATRVNQVVIEEMGVRELAGKPSRFEYAFTLREFIPAPTPPQEPPPPIPPRLDPITATLIVEVIVEGEANFDFSTVTVTVQGTQDQDNVALDRTLTHRTNNRWTEADFPPGTYTARAIVPSDPDLPPASAAAIVQSGQTTQVTITLRRNPQRPTNVAKKFVVHFWFDKAFVEPCMRHVLRQVADYARSHAGEKMLIVGNTDKSGSDNYNLSLGDRRARSIHAYLTFGRDQAGALTEWNLLRRSQDGQQRTVKDNWNVRQYQYLLQTLGFYPSNIKDNHDALTTTGVKGFQNSKGLPPTGIVNDATWEKLIESYLSLDPQAIADAQFFRNCGDEPLKWVSCGEQHPRDDTPIDACAPSLAWRPNRRTEILFVRSDRLPRPEPIPVTFNLPGTPPVGSDWCVGSKDPDPQGTARRCDFLKQNCSTTPAPDEWCVEPVEPGSITVSGSIKDENGESLGIVKYVLIAPDGKFMDGERKCGGDRGQPIKGKTNIDGNFAYTDQSAIGIYTMEVELPHPPQIAHAKTKPAATGRGSVVCKRLDNGDSIFDVIIRSGTPSQFAVNPLITLTSAVVVVKKSYTNPARQLVTLKTDSEFIGSGTLERSSNAIRFFTAATGNTEITFNGTDNVFDGAQLTAGIPLFAEGETPSTTVDDVQLTLTLSSVDLLVGSPSTATMTGVELTLEIGDRRSALGVDPVPLSTADKINPGRFLEVKNSTNTHERALLIVRQANPAAFTGDLELTTIDNKVQIFTEADEVPASTQTALPTPQVIPNGTIPAGGVKFWAEGVTVSTTLRDTGFQLGIKDVEKEGDRVSITVNSFTLRVEGATQIPGTTTFVGSFDATAVVTIVADITPVPSPVPADFVTWSPNATATANPLRRTVPRNTIANTTVTATFKGVTRSVTIRVIQIDIVGTATAAAPPLTSVQIGLWDHAFDPATGNLLNGVAEATNFIGLDSRHFFFRVRDRSAAGEIQLQWRTVFADNTLDDAPASQVITLIETGAGTGIFLSKSVMLVADDVDKVQITNSGLPPGHADAGNRNPGQSNHRLRHVTVNDAHPLDGKVVAEYTLAPNVSLTKNVFVFNRSPEERRRIRIHLVNVRSTPSGVGILTAARRDLVKRTFQSIYAACGIFADVDEILIDPPASCTGWVTRYQTDPIAVDPSVETASFSSTLVPSTSQSDLINAVRAMPTFRANDLYILCVARVYNLPIPTPPAVGLLSGGGIAFPDSFTAAGAIARSFAFVGVRSNITEFAEVHEATHNTTNLRNAAGGHFDLGTAAAVAVGNLDGKNLMNRFFLTNTLGVSNPKRLWNDSLTNSNYSPALVIPAQIDTIRASRFVSNF